MPTPAFYLECDRCTAHCTWTATKDGHEIRLCGHHANQHMEALKTAGFRIEASTVSA